MREDRWVVAVLLVSLVLQVQATYTSSEYYRGGACPVGADVGGSFTAPELPPIAGVPGTDPNFLSYLWQQLCKGSCHKPLKPLTTDDNILDMLKLNTNFQCENKDVRLNGDDVLKSWNAQVQKPLCEVVGDTVVCIVNTVHQIIYVNIVLLTCAVNHKIFVVSPGETFGNFQCYLTPNLYATLLHDVFESDFLSNPKTDVKKSERPNLVFAPESLGKVVLTYLKLWHLMPATKTLQEYDHLLKKWEQVCGENTGHNTTAVCTSMTAKMANVCKKVLTDKDSDEIAGIKKCVNEFYKGLEKSTKDAEAHDYWCGLKKWEMDKEMTECVNSKSNPRTPKEHGGPFAFISSICGSIFYMGKAVISGVQITLDTITCLDSWVNVVLGWGSKIIGVIYYNKETAMFSAAWLLICSVYKFSGKLYKDAPGSSSICYSITNYGFRFLLSPMTFFRSVKKDHKARIHKKVHSSLSQGNFPTKEHVSSYVNERMGNFPTKEHVSSYVNERLIENNAATRQSYTEVVDNYLSRKQIPDTEFVESLIQKGMSENKERTAQFCGNSLRNLMAEEREKMNRVLQRSIETMLSDQNESVQGPESDQDAMAKVLNPSRPPIAENREAGNAERGRRLRRYP